MTIRLLATYRQFKPNTIVTLASGTETMLVNGGNATTDLSGGVPFDYKLPANNRQNNLSYAPDGAPLGISDSTGKILSAFSGIAAPGAPTGLALTAIAGGVLATMTAPASNGGTAIIGYEVTLSTGLVQIGETTTVTVNAPAGIAVTATAKAINGFDKSAASAVSNSVTPTGVAPSVPATAITLTGPTTGTTGVATSAYTVALSPNGGTVASPVTVTPAAVTGVTFAPTSLTLTTASPSGTFTATATTTGTKAISVTNNGGLTNPAAISLAVAAAGAGGSGTMRLVGTQNQVAEPAPATAAQSNSNIIKMQAPGGAIGARVTIYNKSALLGCSSYKVSIAPTDIAAIDTIANAYNAQVAGVVNNVTASGANPLGFTKATWKGAAQSRRIFPSNAQIPSFGYNNQEDSVTSDLIPLVPKRATDRANEEYYFIIRSNFTVAIGENIGTCVAATLQGLATEWTNTNGADAPLIQSGFVSTDAVDGAYTIPASMGSQGNTPVLAIEWVYPAGVTPTTFWHVGDSITEGYQWPRWAVNRKSTAAKPLHHVNLGGSTTRTESFVGNMYLNLQSMAKPSYVVMPILSINNYAPQSDYDMAAAQFEWTRLQEIAVYLKALGIKIIWWTPFNYGANPATPGDVSTPWNYLYTNAKAYATANNITFMDINGDSRLVRSVYNASTNPTGWIDPDNTHPSNPTGKAGFAAVYTDTLTALGF